MSEIPVHSRPRRLVDWINPTGAKKVHSLIDKVYQRKNLEMAWEMVKANRGSGGVDGQNLDGFAAQLEPQLDRLQSELKEDVYRPQPVRQVQIPKAGKPASFECWEFPLFMTGYASRRYSIGWNRSSSRCLMKPTSDIGEGDRRRTPCAKFGRKFRADGSGSWTLI
jgi:hypothetical protein